MTSTLSPRSLYWTGVVLGPLAWAANTQIEYALVPFWCERRALVLIVTAAALTLAALAGGLLSWRAARTSLGFEWEQPSGGMPRSFIAWLGAGSGILFALVIADQLTASLMVSSCLR
jgi:hypothetical protein